MNKKYTKHFGFSAIFLTAVGITILQGQPASADYECFPQRAPRPEYKSNMMKNPPHAGCMLGLSKYKDNGILIHTRYLSLALKDPLPDPFNPCSTQNYDFVRSGYPADYANFPNCPHN